MDYHMNESHDENHPFEEETTIASPPNEGETRSTVQSDLDATIRLPTTIDPMATPVVEPYASAWPNSDSDLPLPLPTYVDNIFQDDNELLPNWCTQEDDTFAGYPLPEVENPGAGSNSALLRDFTHTPLLDDFMEHSTQSFRDPEPFILPDNVAGTAGNQQQVQSDAFFPGLQESVDVREFFDAQPQGPLRVGNLDDGIYPHFQAMQGYHSLDATMQQTLAGDLLPPFDAASATGWTLNETAPNSLNELPGAELLLSDNVNFSIGSFGLLGDVSAPGLLPSFSEPVSDVGLSQQLRPETEPTSTEGLFWSQALDTSTETVMDVTSTQRNATHGNIEVQTTIPSTVQGPSRPVHLPPRRKGGRKGPLSVQEKERRKEARNRGVCIRCRRMRERCSGGFPCVNCYTKSKAPCWKYPYIKAEFLEIVESVTYIGSICSTEKRVISEIDRKTIEAQVASISRIADRQRVGIFKTKIPAFMHIEGVIIWPAALDILKDVLRRHDHGDRARTIPHHILDAVRCLAKDKGRLPPIICSVPPPSGSWYEWAIAHMQFCLVPYLGRSQVESISGLDEFIPLLDESIPLLDESISLLDDCGWDTLIWLSRRHFELCLFQVLQGLANKMTSTPSKESPTKEKSDTAEIIFNCFCLGRMPESEGRHESPASTERQNQIRSALHSYLRIAIDRLPAFSDFWAGLGEDAMPFASEMLEVARNDVRTFETREIASTTMLREYADRRRHTDIEPSDVLLRVDDNVLEHLAIISRGIVMGSFFQSSLKEVITELSVSYAFRIRMVFVLFADSGLPSVGDDFLELLNPVNNMRSDLRNCLEKLEKDPRNVDLIKESEQKFLAAGQLMRSVDEMLQPWAEILEVICKAHDLLQQSIDVTKEFINELPQPWAEILGVICKARDLLQQSSDDTEESTNDRNHEDGDCDLQTEHDGTT